MRLTRPFFAACLLLPALAQRPMALPITNARQRLEIARCVSAQEAAARRVLVRLASAERRYKARYGTYVSLDALQARKLRPLGENGVDPDSGYTFHSFPEEGRYVLLVIPPIDSLTAYVSETGKLRRLTRSEALARLRPTAP